MSEHVTVTPRRDGPVAQSAAEPPIRIPDEMIPPQVRTTAYFSIFGASAVVLLASGLAGVWLDGEVAVKVIASCGVVTSVLGFIAGGLGIAYRPSTLGKGPG